MANFSKTLEYQTAQTNSAGLAQERYGIYLENTEAKLNQLTATWEKLAANTMESGFVKYLINAANWFLNLADTIGILRIVIIALTMYMATKTVVIIPIVSGLIDALAISMGATIPVAMALGSVLGVGLVVAAGLAVVAIVEAISKTEDYAKAALDAADSVSTLTDTISKLENEQRQLHDLGLRFDQLKNNTSKTNEQLLEFLDVQNKIKDLLPDINGSYNAQGNFIVAIGVNLAALNKLKQDEIDLNQKLLEQANVDLITNQIKNYGQQAEKLKTLQTAVSAPQRKDGSLTGADSGAYNLFFAERLKTELASQVDIVKSALNQISQLYFSSSDIRKKLILDQLALEKSFGKEAIEQIKLLESQFVPIIASQTATIKRLAEIYDGLLKTIKDVVDMQSLVDNTITKSQTTGLLPEDITALSAVFPEYLDYLSVENDQIIITTDNAIKLKEHTRELMEAKLDSAKASLVELQAQQQAQSLNNFMSLGIVPKKSSVTNQQIDTLKQEIELLEASIDARKKYSSNFETTISKNIGMVNTLIRTYEKLGAISPEDINQLKDAFGDKFLKALKNANGVITLNKDGLKELQIEQIDLAITATQDEIAINGASLAASMQIEIYNRLKQEIKWGTAARKEEIATLEEQSSKTVSAMLTIDGALSSLISSKKEYGSISISQITQMQEMFGMDYAYALEIQNGQIVINIEKLKQLVITKARDAVATTMQAAAQGNYTNSLMLSVQAAQIYLDLVQSEAYWNDMLAASLGGGGGGGVNQAQEDYNDILQKTIDMLTQEAEARKQALQDELDAYKESIDAKKKLLDDELTKEKEISDARKKDLEDQLDGYKKIIDAAKELIDQKEAEKDYGEQVGEKNKEISDIDAQLFALQFDNSEEAEAKKLELAAERVAKVKELADIQNNYSIESQKAALDREYTAFEEQNKREQDALDIKYAAFEKEIEAEQLLLDQDYENFKKIQEQKIRAIEDYLSRTGAIQAQAIELLKNHSQELYDRLNEWNKQYGDGIDLNLTKYKAALTYMLNNPLPDGGGGGGGGYAQPSENASKGKGLPFIPFGSDRKGNYTYDPTTGGYRNSATGAVIPKSKWDMLPYHQGGIVGGMPGANDSTEVMAKLLKGELVSTPSQISNFLNRTLPNIVANFGGGGDINMPITIKVDGNLDTTVVPQIKEIASRVINEINDIMRVRGYKRNPVTYSQ